MAVATMVCAVLLGLTPFGASAAPTPKGNDHVVLIGVPGLQWSDIHGTGTPNLWRLTGQGSAAALSVKAVAPRTCPIDGWLTVSAGQRSQLRHGGCGLPPAPSGKVVPGFDAMRTDNAHNKYASKLGLLGDAVHRSGGCTMAIGPGAAIGAADSGGSVDAYAPSTTQMPPDALSRCALTTVDIDDVARAYVNAGVDVDGRQVRVTAHERAAAATRADEQIGRVLAAVPPGATVLLAGLADSSDSAHLHVALAAGPGYGTRYLTATSTQTEGLVTLTDLTATVLDRMRLAKPRDAVGAPWHRDGARPAGTPSVVRALNDQDVAARAYGRMILGFDLFLVILQVALYAFATVALRRKGRRLLTVTKVLALAAASVPVASYLANLVPWWSSGHSGLVLALLLLAGIAVVTAISVAGPWRRSVTGPGAVVGGVTVLVPTLDVMTGSHLQNCSMLGYTPLVAGRFYGFANTTWAVWITGLIILVGALAGHLLGRDGARSATATGVVVAAGVVAMMIDGAPMLGTDFGGIIAIIPGFAVFVTIVAGRRIRLSQLAVVLAAGAVLVLGFAYLDSLRANPTHIGEFWDNLVSGDAGTVLLRKLQGMLRTFGNWELTVIAVVGAGFLFFALQRPLAWRAAALHTAYEHAPALRATLAAVLVTAGVGMLVNDSGVAIPALALTTAIPLALAASVRAMELDGGDEAPSRPEPAEPTSTPKA